MSTLPEITAAMVSAVMRNDYSYARAMGLQAAHKIGGKRGERMLAELNRPYTTPLKHWSPVDAGRSPWVHHEVALKLEQAMVEMQYATQLHEAGERLRPLMLVGETRCGKTSSMAAIAKRFDLKVMQLKLGSMLGQFMGTTANNMNNAIQEIHSNCSSPILWVMDEIDAIASTRTGESGAAKELTNAVGILLTELERLPTGTMLAATTNCTDLIDPAVKARFSVVEFPKWKDLSEWQRREFAESHGTSQSAVSYADAVEKGRLVRVGKIIEKAKKAA
jgi:hypothetical protein